MPRRREKGQDIWTVRVGPGGWAVVGQHAARTGGLSALPAEQVLVNVRTDEAGRFRVWELYLFPTDRPITAERVRAIRVAAIEDMLNLPEERAAIEARAEEEVDPREIFHPRSRTYRKPKYLSEKYLARHEIPATDTLAPPAGGGYGDDFYARVANVYRDALRDRDNSRAPVEAIRAEANVPRSTAARWVKEARRRGLLGPAPAPGKKGA